MRSAYEGLVLAPGERGAVRIVGAELVPLGQLSAHSKDWDPQDTLVLVCQSGGRSGRAAQMLANEGFSHVINLRGGMMAHNQSLLPIAS